MIANGSSNPFLFACGVPRSGTTLLQRMLDSHSQMTVANDTHFIPRALEITDKKLVHDAIASLEIPLSDELADNAFNYHRFYRTGIDRNEFDAVRADSDTYQKLVKGIFDRIARKSGKLLAGEKTPDYVRRLRLLNGLFPGAKLIHLIRDGRDVALSLLDWSQPKKGPGRIPLWNENPIAVCALWWKWLVDEGLQQARQLDESVYCEIRYEELTENPEQSARQLCEFLKLHFDGAMLEYNKGKKSDRPNLSAKSAWLGPQTGLRDWCRDLQQGEIELFEALAGDTLENCGYELSTYNCSPAILSQAKTFQQWWQQHFLSQHAPQQDSQPASDSVYPVTNQTTT